jgi:hypothetical protein
MSEQASADVAANQPAPARASGGDIRLSFGLFYIVLKWGTERRQAGRIAEDRRAYPALTSTHAPVLIGAWALLLLALYYGLQLALRTLVVLFS